MATLTVDDAILAMLDVSPLHLYVEGAPATPNAIFDGNPEADETEKVIDVPLPYLVYASAVGDDFDERAGGWAGGLAKPFQLTGVGVDRWQAQWILAEARSLLSRKIVTVGAKSGLMRVTDSLLARKDDDYTQPGGEPLFYGVDQYEVAL